MILVKEQAQFAYKIQEIVSSYGPVSWRTILVGII